MHSPVRVTVIPIYRRHWLYHARWEGLSESQTATVEWTPSSSFEDRVAALRQRISASVSSRVRTQWKDLESSQEGTFKHWIFRLVQGVLAREDPDETFLKAVPGLQEVSHVEITFPESLPEALVRRKMRNLCKKKVGYHRWRLVGWGALTAPLSVLMLTPLPNIPLYYGGYRTVSHYRAWGGARTLLELFEHVDGCKLQQLRQELLQLKSAGIVFPADSWPVELLYARRQYLDIMDSMKVRTRLRMGMPEEPQEEAVMRFRRSAMLERITQPPLRAQRPLGDEAAMQLAKELDAPMLVQQVACARKRWVGAHFPISPFGPSAKASGGGTARGR